MAYDCVLSPWLECHGGCDYCPLYGALEDELDNNDEIIDVDDACCYNDY